MGIFGSLFERQLVGLDIGVSGIKAVELHGKESPRLVAYNRVPLPWDAISPDGEIRSRPIVVNALKKLFELKSFTSKRVAVGASGNAIITKKITVPRMSEAELRDQLYWEAEQYIPFNINEVNLDFAIIGNSPQTQSGTPMMDALLVAAKRDYIQNLTSLVEEAGLTPAIVDNQSFALGNAFEFNYGHLVDDPNGGACVIIDFGAGSTKISIVEGDKTTFTRELRQCGIGCTLMLSERLGVAVDQAEKMKIQQGDTEGVESIVGEYVQGMVDEITRTLDFAISQSPDHSIEGIYICGGASRTHGLVDALEEKLPAPVVALNPVQNIAGSGKKMNAQAIREMAYLGAVAIGLALRTAGDTA